MWTGKAKIWKALRPRLIERTGLMGTGPGDIEAGVLEEALEEKGVKGAKGVKEGPDGAAEVADHIVAKTPTPGVATVAVSHAGTLKGENAEVTAEGKDGAEVPGKNKV